MKTLISLLSICLLFGCIPIEEGSATNYKPILMDRNDLHNSIEVLDPRPIENPGKIYRYQNLIFINESWEGVHVINNDDPTNPESLGFIKIMGNQDIAIKNGIIYADNGPDLVAIEYNLDQLNIVSRTNNVFQEIVPPDFGFIPDEYQVENRPPNTVIIKWVEK